jgi:hypothetical protein
MIDVKERENVLRLIARADHVRSRG